MNSAKNVRFALISVGLINAALTTYLASNHWVGAACGAAVFCMLFWLSREQGGQASARGRAGRGQQREQGRILAFERDGNACRRQQGRRSDQPQRDAHSVCRAGLRHAQLIGELVQQARTQRGVSSTAGGAEGGRHRIVV